MLPTILFFTFLALIVSLFLVAILLLHEKAIKKLSFHMVSFGAGALLATGFTDTLSEAVAATDKAFLYTTLFIVLYFIIERAFLHFHHHDHEEEQKTKLPIPLLIFGDGMHNFIDGVSIATAFLVSFPLGLITTLAVFIHEIPHEIGDFGILLHAGFGRSKVLMFNLLTGIVALLGALLGYFFASHITGALGILLSLTSANFIYLSLADLLPEIHHNSKDNAFAHVLPFILGAAIMLTLTTFFKG